MNLDGATVLTYTYIYTVGSCFTVHDVPGNFCLLRRGRILFKVCWVKTLKNILNEQITQVQKLNNQSLDAAKIVIAMIPVLAVYPFLQKYFVTGITLGSVKG